MLGAEAVAEADSRGLQDELGEGPLRSQDSSDVRPGTPSKGSALQLANDSHRTDAVHNTYTYGVGMSVGKETVRLAI